MRGLPSHNHLQAQTELDRLIQLEYWLKYDFSGCVRKLLPARQQVGYWERVGFRREVAVGGWLLGACPC